MHIGGLYRRYCDTEKICSTPGGAAVFGTDTMPVKLTEEDRIAGRLRKVKTSQPVHVEIRRLPEGRGHVDGIRDDRLQPVPWQGRLQYMPRRRQREHSDARDRL